jgi:hypothetical protein
MLTATLFTSILFIGVAIAVVWVAEPAAVLIDDMPRLMQEIQAKLGDSDGDGTIAKANDAAKAINDAVSNSSEKVAVEVAIISDSSTCNKHHDDGAKSSRSSHLCDLPDVLSDWIP